MSEQLVQIVLSRLQLPQGAAADVSQNAPTASKRPAVQPGAAASSRSGACRGTFSTHAVLVIGGIGEGKTAAVRALADELLLRGVDTDGILASRVEDSEAKRTIGYDLIAIRSGKRIPLARERPPGQPIGRFFLRERALQEAKRLLADAATSRSVVILDEVGRLELSGGGHATALEAVLAGRALPVLTVRRSFAKAIRSRFRLLDADEYDVGAGQVPE